MSKTITNAMTVDVEDYFQVSAFEKTIPRKDWDSVEHRVYNNTNRILDIFQKYNIKSTFFMLGWVAERYPELVKRIVNENHELASHGYEHIRVTQQTPAEFRADIIKTKMMLEDIGGVQIKGYRAPSYSITENNMWAIDELADSGHIYSSSIYPIKHDLYGIPSAPRFAYRHEKSGLLEIPITTVKLANKKLPCGGGGFFRLFPYSYSRWAINRINNLEKQSALFYFHPWEIDIGQPKIRHAPWKSKFRHYLNIKKMELRLDRLINDFAWGRLDQIFIKK
jgi:polysaccharide deacetylase family protein (PEP-CTERM system associated)